MPGQNNCYFKSIRISLFLWVLIFQFLAAPFCEIRGLGFLISNAYAEKDPALEAAKANCKAPQQWTGSKCINPANVVEMRREATDHNKQCKGLTEIELKDCQEKFTYIQAKCEKDPNPKSCYDENKGKTLEDLKHDLAWNYDENSNFGLQVVHGVATGINLAMAITAVLGTKSVSHCTSRLVFSLVAAANLLMEIYFYFLVDGKLRDIKEEYEQSVAEDSYGGQKKAFEYVIKEQETVADVHNTKFTIYMLLSAGYLAVIAVAIYEIITTGSAGCIDPKVGNKNLLSPQQIKLVKNLAYAENKNNQSSFFGHLKNTLIIMGSVFKNPFIENSMAEDQDFLNKLIKNPPEKTEAQKREGNARNADVNGLSGKVRREKDKDFSNSNMFLKLITMGIGAIPGAFLGIVPAIRKFMMSSWGMIILSTTASLWGFLLAGFSKSAANEADLNKAKIEELLKVFNKSVEDQCDKRDDLSNPKCYCYNDDGGKNASRTRSQTCQDLWKADGMIAPPKAQGKAQAGSQDPKGCVTISGEYDPDCKCKMVTQAQGKNLCKTGFLPTQLGSLGNASGMNDVVKQLNAITNGNFTRGQMNPTETKKLAARMRDMAKKLKEQNKNLLLSKGYDSSKDKEMAKSLANLLSKEDIAKYGPSNQLAALSDNTPAGINPDALKEAREKAGISTASYQGGGGGPGKKEGEKAPGFNFAGDSGGGSGKDLNFMEKQYDYKANDIVKNDDASIWQVISNRYNVSGLRRLFDENTESPKKEVTP